jgi:hypothetical protein
MSTYLEELAVRFVERDGLCLEDQQKIAAAAAGCGFNPHQRQQSPAVVTNWS